MRRLSLLPAAVLVSVVAFAGAAHAAPLPSSGADAGASIRQADDPEPGDADGDGVPDASDKCPTVAGSENAQGCPDADNDGIVDSADACPTVPGGPIDGCPAVRIWMNGYLQQNADIYANCIGPESCKPSGTVIMKLTHAAARRVGLASTLIGQFPIDHPCGPGVTCAQEKLGSAVNKKLNAWIKAWRNTHGSPVYLPGTITAVMTSPRKETMSTKVKLGLGSNGGRFTLYGAGYPRPSAGSGSGDEG